MLSWQPTLGNAAAEQEVLTATPTFNLLHPLNKINHHRNHWSFSANTVQHTPALLRSIIIYFFNLSVFLGRFPELGGPETLVSMSLWVKRLLLSQRNDRKTFQRTGKWDCRRPLLLVLLARLESARPVIIITVVHSIDPYPAWTVGVVTAPIQHRKYTRALFFF